MVVQRGMIPVPGGWLGLGWTERGVVRLILPVPERAAAAWLLEACLPEASPGEPDAVLARRLAGFLSGEEPWPWWPVDLGSGTPFQRRVWEELRRIPAGRTRTYGEVALALGSRGAARAVGGACAANPVPLLVPCHRVVGRAGPGGFSAGLPWKERLLALERRHRPSATPRPSPGA